MAHTLASVWAIARSPLLFGGALPADGPTLSLLTNRDFLYVHANSRNQTVFQYTQANNSCGPRTTPPCDWMAHGWTKWAADLLPSPPTPIPSPPGSGNQAGGGTEAVVGCYPGPP